ncbi:MAG: AgmX/PglI C-terminal domain-containing protein [Candidatus Electryonea clarkiae]|nr:AgmX/PglI C-terminal domain-containing protein [Candidatus Electryonea clarkiae]MDP8285689.1 AgmX/PglI C-terminal domain-containing protein [Candidatus Electryonea clarkiae]
MSYKNFKAQSFIPLLFPLLLLIFCCCEKVEKKQQEETSGQTIESRNQENIYEYLIPYGNPVWEEGALFSRETMVETVRIRTEGLNRAFHQTEKERPGLHGKLTAHFFVNPDGAVSDVEIIESDWNDMFGEVFEDTLISHLQKWTFPPGASKPIGVTQPWTFGSS